MDSDPGSPYYSLNPSSPLNNTNVIDISDDTGEEDNSGQPKVELPNSPKKDQPFKTSELISQIQTLDNQLATIKNRTQYHVSFYQRRIKELEANSSCF